MGNCPQNSITWFRAGVKCSTKIGQGLAWCEAQTIDLYCTSVGILARPQTLFEQLSKFLPYKSGQSEVLNMRVSPYLDRIEIAEGHYLTRTERCFRGSSSSSAVKLLWSFLTATAVTGS